MTVAVSSDGVVVWASDPDPSAGEIVFDFVSSGVLLVLASEGAAAEITGSVAETLDDATSAAAGASGASGSLDEELAALLAEAAGTVEEGAEPEQPLRLTGQRPFVRGVGGRTVTLELSADLGHFTAHANTRAVFADDEELLEII